MKSSIQIVCTTDDTYIQHCTVMLASLFESNKDEQFNIYIITNIENTTNLQNLKTFLKHYSYPYSIITIDQGAIKNAPVTHHISIATYFRLFIPKVLPPELSRVLFLDADMVIRKSIRPLWETNLDEYTHAATIAAGMDDYPAEIGLPQNSFYFNAGMMLINLQAWRKHRVFERGCDLISHEARRLKWWDQDVLNLLLHNSWYPLDLTWNAQPFVYSDSLSAEYSYWDRYQKFNYWEAKSDPAVVHFVGGGNAKPWHYFCTHPFKQDYLNYLKVTPWHKTPLLGTPNLAARLRFKLGLASKVQHLLRPFQKVINS